MRISISITTFAACALGAICSGAQDDSSPAPQSQPVRDPIEGVSISARLGADPVQVGPTLTATIVIELAEGVTATDSGIPGFILQLDPPQGVELSGKRITEFRQLSRNEFLMEPWERLVEETPLEVQFTLTEVPSKEATLGIILVGYVASDPGKNDAFLRRRLELPIVSGAPARKGDDLDSSWGPDETLLTIGSKAPAFQSPLLQGGQLDLADQLGTRPLLFTTYRAHW